MDLRKLLNEDQLNCLYCNHICEVKSSSYASSQGQRRTHFATFTCTECKELFSIVIDTSSHTDFLNDSKTTHLFMCQTFSCKSIVVTIMNNKFLIKNISPIEIEVPQFEVNFKNKEELYNKLKTYLLFS